MTYILVLVAKILWKIIFKAPVKVAKVTYSCMRKIV